MIACIIAIIISQITLKINNKNSVVFDIFKFGVALAIVISAH